MFTTFLMRKKKNESSSLFWLMCTLGFVTCFGCGLFCKCRDPQGSVNVQ